MFWRSTTRAVLTAAIVTVATGCGAATHGACVCPYRPSADRHGAAPGFFRGRASCGSRATIDGLAATTSGSPGGTSVHAAARRG